MAMPYVCNKRPVDDTDDQSGSKRTKHSRLLNYIDEMYDRISLDGEDKKKSRTYVDELLKKMIANVRQQDNGEIYCHQVVKAGSVPINAKIGKADEFDTNILLNLEPKRVQRIGQISYRLIVDGNQGACQSSMYAGKTLVRSSNGETIPNGYAVVEVSRSDTISTFIHYEKTSSVMRSSAMPQNFNMNASTYYVPFHTHQSVGYGPSNAVSKTEVINKGEQSGCIQLIPLDVRKDLHEKIKRAKFELQLNDVSISNTSQGPALTLTVTPNRHAGIDHKISVDITVSLKCETKLKLRDFGWPRGATMKAFDDDIIDAAIVAGVHLVPKKDLFWSISFSRAEKALLSSIDRQFGSRKRVLKLLKKYVAKCKSASASKLPGISTHIVKTQILWSCEMHADEPVYWNRENRDQCLINTMKELEMSLIERNLKEYFNDSLYTLERKDPAVLCELANFLAKEREKLKSMMYM